MRRSWLLLFLLLFNFCKTTENIEPKALTNTSLEPVSTGEIIRHTYYTLSYSEDNEQANWVYYTLTSENINGSQSRTDDFRADPFVKTESASLTDYKYSGYDRGHMCPAADMTLNKTAMSETFFLSNMSPQKGGFNGGIWSKLEKQVRNWISTSTKLHVVAGPIFKDNLGTIGDNKVTVPGYYYKIIFDGKDKMIGFILPHESSTKSLDQFAVSVDQIELQTGIDFFSGLEDSLENKLEENTSTSKWF